MFGRFHCLVAVVGVTGCSALLAQTTIYVDVTATPPGNGSQASPFVTMGDALTAANNGDTVLVAPGTYVETLLVLGKSIDLRSTHGADTTIVDANGVYTVLQMSGIVTPITVAVTGFTLTNGNGVQFIGGRAGGVSLSGASVTMTDCKITGNVGGDGAPGGVRVWSEDLQMVRCEITDNTGGDTPLNKAGLSGRAGPGGVQVYQLSGNPVDLTMTDCLVSGNTGGAGFMFLFSGGLGGAGGLGVLSTAAALATGTLTNCVLVGNVGGDGQGSGRGGAGGLGLGAGATELVHCTVANNIAGQVVGAASATSAGGLHALHSATAVTTVNSIFWGNTDGLQASQIEVLAGTVAASYCDVEGGFAGIGNLNVDPLFRDVAGDDLHLRAASPCIDAGDSSASGVPPLDFEGDPRCVGAGVDIGADEACLVGSDEGFDLESLVNQQGEPRLCQKLVQVGETVQLLVPPIPAAFVGSVGVGFLQFRAAGTPGPVTPLGLPEVHVDPFAAQTIYYSISPLAAGGYGLISPIPQPLSGSTIRVQYFAVTTAAANGIFAATAAHEFEVQ